MQKMHRTETGLPGVTLVEPRVFNDDRGFFMESYNQRDFEHAGIGTRFVQDNHSCSAKGVIRGLHFQAMFPQEKLVRVIRGKIYDIVVDVRKGSPAYSRAVGIVLSAADHRILHIPVGCAHGFLALENHTEVLYKASDFYHPEYDAGIFWNDPDLHIAWPLEEHHILHPIVSEKDRQLPRLREIEPPFVYDGWGGSI